MVENLRITKIRNIYFKMYGVSNEESGIPLGDYNPYEQQYHKWCCVCGKRMNGEGISEPEYHRMFCKECYPLRQRVLDAHNKFKLD